MTDANCTNCRFSRVDHEDDGSFTDGPLMRCHRYPAQIFVFDDQVSQALPVVRAEDWCGEYQPEGEPFSMHRADG